MTPDRLAVIIDGPEKAGKTTLLAEVVRQAQIETGDTLPILYRKWSGRARPDEHVYFRELVRWYGDVSDDNPRVALWDRGWPSEFVYGTLLKEDRPMAGKLLCPDFETGLSPWLIKVILLGPSAEALIAKRDETDLPVDPAHEQYLFGAYGAVNGWKVVENEWSPQWLAYFYTALRSNLISRFNTGEESELWKTL